MEVITSTSNNLVKKIKLLCNDSKFRQEQGEFIVEGENLISQIPDLQQIKKLLVEKTKLELFKSIVDEINLDIVTVVSSNVMKSISDTKTPSGILAIVDLNNRTNHTGKDILVIADTIRDPGNLGTIMRTMAALDLHHLLCIDTVSPYSPKVIRSSMGGIFYLNIEETDSSNIDLSHYRVLSLDMHGENIYRKIKLDNNEKIAVVVGNESNGLSSNIKKQTNDFISIPMPGKMESLNAGVALSVALYQIKYLLGGL